MLKQTIYLKGSFRSTRLEFRKKNVRYKAKVPKSDITKWKKNNYFKIDGYWMDFQSTNLRGSCKKIFRKKLLCTRLLIISHRIARLLPSFDSIFFFSPILIKCLTNFLLYWVTVFCHCSFVFLLNSICEANLEWIANIYELVR